VAAMSAPSFVRWMSSMALVAGLAAGCHQKAAPEDKYRVNPNVVTREELAEVGSGSVYDAIVRRHGLFLKDRGRTSIYGKNIQRAVVFIADTEYGVIETMRNLPADRYEMVRYYPDTEASAKFGSQYMGGVIQLVPRYE
jgi:hypothetical protein